MTPYLPPFGDRFPDIYGLHDHEPCQQNVCKTLTYFLQLTPQSSCPLLSQLEIRWKSRNTRSSQARARFHLETGHIEEIEDSTATDLLVRTQWR